MLRTNNLIDTAELEKTLNHYSIKDNVADKTLKQIDMVLDAVTAYGHSLDALLSDLDDEGCTLAERRAIYLSLQTIFKRAVDHKTEAITRG